MKRSFLEKAAAVPHIVWTVLFIVAPLLFVVFFAFTDRNGSVTFNNVLGLTEYTHIFARSVLFALIATAVCLLIGYPLAFCMSRLKPKTQKVVVLILMLPMWISLLIRTYSLLAILGNGGMNADGTLYGGLINSFLASMHLKTVNILGTPGAVILGMVYDFLPYMVLPIYTSLAKLDIKYFEAAEDLGCNGIQTLFKVALPLSRTGVISGVTMVFVPSISTFYISSKLGMGKFDLIGDTIERLFYSNRNVGAALSLAMMILILLSVAVMNRFGEDEGDLPV